MARGRQTRSTTWQQDFALLRANTERTLMHEPSASCLKLCERIQQNDVGPVLSLRSVLDANSPAADIRAVLEALLTNDSVRFFSPGQQEALFTSVDLVDLLLRVLRRQHIFGIELGENRFSAKALDALISGLEAYAAASDDTLRYDAEFCAFATNARALRGEGCASATAESWIREGVGRKATNAPCAVATTTCAAASAPERRARDAGHPCAGAARSTLPEAMRCPATAVAFTFLDTKMGVSERAVQRIKDATKRRRAYDKARALFAIQSYNRALSAGRTQAEARKDAAEVFPTTSWLHYSNHHWILENENMTRCFWRPYQERMFWVLAGYDVPYVPKTPALQAPRGNRKWVNPFVQKLAESYKRATLSAHQTHHVHTSRLSVWSGRFPIVDAPETAPSTSTQAPAVGELTHRMRAVDENHLKRVEKFFAMQIDMWSKGASRTKGAAAPAPLPEAPAPPEDPASSAAAVSRITHGEHLQSVADCLGSPGLPSDYGMCRTEALAVVARLRFWHALVAPIRAGMPALVECARPAVIAGAAKAGEASVSVARAIQYVEEFALAEIARHLETAYVHLYESPNEAGWYPANVERICELQSQLLSEKRVGPPERAAEAMQNRRLETARRSELATMPAYLGVGKATYCSFQDVSRWEEHAARERAVLGASADIEAQLASRPVQQSTLPQTLLRRLCLERCYAVTLVPRPSVPSALLPSAEHPWPSSHPYLRPASGLGPASVMYTLEEVVRNLLVPASPC